MWKGCLVPGPVLGASGRSERMGEGDLSVKQTLTVSRRRAECSGGNKWRIASVCRTRSYTARGRDTDFSERERLIWGDGGSEIRGDFMEVAFV